MARKQKPRDLLNRVLKLISNDIKEIEKLSLVGKLEGDISTTLVKYSDALIKMIKDSDVQEKVENKTVSDMGTDELTEKVEQYMSRLKKK